MKLSNVDSLQEALQIIQGVRKNMIMIESSSVSLVPKDLFIVYITALEKAVLLMGAITDAGQKPEQPDLEGCSS